MLPGRRTSRTRTLSTRRLPRVRQVPCQLLAAVAVAYTDTQAIRTPVLEPRSVSVFSN